MKNRRRRVLLAVLLIISIANFTRIMKGHDIRTVEVLTVFVIGVLSALLFKELSKKNEE